MEYSVLMSVYRKDKAEYVKLAIESMLNQTVKPEQYVIVQDGPVPAGVEELLAEYQSKFPDIFTFVILKKNQGLANALNVGLKSCRNNLVARMDADDISLPRRCEYELQIFLEYPQLAICGCNIDEFYEDVNDVRTSRKVPSEYEDILKFSRRRQPFNHPTVMYKKDIIERCGGYLELSRKEDFDLFSRVIMSNNYVRNINMSLYLYRADDYNFARRKSWQTLKNAYWVYWRHMRRNGCNILDFAVMCGGETLFFILPQSAMKKLSNKLLRKEV